MKLLTKVSGSADCRVAISGKTLICRKRVRKAANRSLLVSCTSAHVKVGVFVLLFEELLRASRTCIAGITRPSKIASAATVSVTTPPMCIGAARAVRHM